MNQIPPAPDLPPCPQHYDAAMLSALRDGDLDPQMMRVLQLHVPTCPACQQVIADFQEIGWRLRHQRELDPGQRVWRGVHAVIIARQNRRFPMPSQTRSRVVGGSVGAIVALVVLVVLFFQVIHGVAGRASLATVTATATPAGQITLPNFVGQQFGVVKTQFHQLGLSMTVTNIACPSSQGANVTAQDPAAGTTVAPQSTVHLTVCAGPSFVAVPSVVGMSYQQACQLITQAGLVCAESGIVSATVPQGQVVKTDPVANSSSSRGTVVTIYVSVGPVAPALQIQNAAIADQLAFAYVQNNDVWVSIHGAQPTQLTHLEKTIQGLSWTADQTKLAITYGDYPNIASEVVNVATGATTALPAALFQYCGIGPNGSCPWIGDRYLAYFITQGPHNASYGVYDTQTSQTLKITLNSLPYAPVIHGNSVYYITSQSCATSVLNRLDLLAGTVTTVATLPGSPFDLGINGGGFSVAPNGDAIFLPVASTSGAGCQASPNFSPVEVVSQGHGQPVSAYQSAPQFSIASAAIAPDGAVGAFATIAGSATSTASLALVALPSGPSQTLAPASQSPLAGYLGLRWLGTNLIVTRDSNTEIALFSVPEQGGTQLEPVETILASGGVTFAPEP